MRTPWLQTGLQGQTARVQILAPPLTSWTKDDLKQVTSPLQDSVSSLMCKMGEITANS